MVDVNRAYNFVRNELAEVGLLSDGLYLDHVEVSVSKYKSSGEAGYVFEDIGTWARLGFKPGVIYLPADVPQQPRVPGSTLIDTIRHEFAHAWYYIDQRYFREEWFVRAFGAPYANCNPGPKANWMRQLQQNRRYLAALERCRTSRGRERLEQMFFHREFVSYYASSCACEDFAESFMYFLKYRNSLERFENRPNVYRKLKAVERAIGQKAKRLKTNSRSTKLRVRSA
ncbi:MAG: hypothetical protein U0892_04565 [Pirellulales bacterium]